MSKSICAKITSLVNTNRRRLGKTSPDWLTVRWTLDSDIWRERDRDVLRQKKHVVADDPRRGSRFREENLHKTRSNADKACTS